MTVANFGRPFNSRPQEQFKAELLDAQLLVRIGMSKWKYMTLQTIGTEAIESCYMDLGFALVLH